MAARKSIPSGCKLCRIAFTGLFAMFDCFSVITNSDAISAASLRLWKAQKVRLLPGRFLPINRVVFGRCCNSDAELLGRIKLHELNVCLSAWRITSVSGGEIHRESCRNEFPRRPSERNYIRHRERAADDSIAAFIMHET